MRFTTVGDEPSSKREPLRCVAGCWAISSGGSSKSKSLSVKARGALGEAEEEMVHGLDRPFVNENGVIFSRRWFAYWAGL